MAEVRVKIGADVQELQQGVQKAERELQDLAKTAANTAGSTDRLGRSVSATVSDFGGAARASSGARVALTDLNRVISDAPFGLIAIQNNVDQLAGSFGNLVRESGGVKGALRAIAQSFAGPAGILTLISLAGSAAIVFGDQIAAAFNKAGAEAEKARKAIEDAFDEVAQFSSISGVSFDQTTTEAALPGARARLETEEATTGEIQKQIAEIDRQIARVNQLGAAQSAIDAARGENLTTQRNRLLEQLRAQELNVVAAQAALDGLEQKSAAYKAQEQTQKILLDLGGTLADQSEERKKQLEGQTDEARSQASAIRDAAKEQERLNKLRAQAFAAVQAPSPIGSRKAPQALPNVPSVPDRVFDESAASAAADFAFALEDIQELLDAGMIDSLDAANSQLGLMRERLAELATQGLAGSKVFNELAKEYEILREKVQAFNDAVFATNALADLAVDGVEAVANVKLGFEDAASAVDSMKRAVQGLISELARAALKAAILAGISKGIGLAVGGPALGFGTLFRGFLGIGNAGPSLAASVSAAPASVAPLAGLSVQAQRVQVEPFTTTIRGGDLVLGFQQARQQTARTLGNIPLK